MVKKTPPKKTERPSNNALSVAELRFFNAFLRLDDEVLAYRETHMVDETAADKDVLQLAQAILERPQVKARLEAHYENRLNRFLQPYPVLPDETGKTDLQVQLAKCVTGQKEALRVGNLSAFATLVKQESELKGLLVNKSEVKVVRVNEMSQTELQEALDESERLMRELGLDAGTGSSGKTVPSTKH